MAILCVFASITDGYKVLFLAPINIKSHWLFSQSLIKAIINRGHEVTCVTSTSFGDKIPANYTEILIDPPLDLNALSK